MATITEIAQQINESKQPITLIYAFNSTGKTKLCVEYKNLTKREDSSHAFLGLVLISSENHFMQSMVSKSLIINVMLIIFNTHSK